MIVVIYAFVKLCYDYTQIVKFTQTSRSTTQFDKYRFRLEDRITLPRTKSRPAEAPGEFVKFSGLVPGRLYIIIMRTVSGNVTSYPEFGLKRLCNYTRIYINSQTAHRSLPKVTIPKLENLDRKH